MEALFAKFEEKAQATKERFATLKKEHADFVLGEYTLGQVLTGMKGIQALMCETSALDPVEGIRFRGYSIPELRDKLPKAEGGDEPLPEGIFYLMLFNELPTEDDVKMLSKAWVENGDLPQYAKDVIDAIPVETHPMTQFSMGILSLQKDSKFAEAYTNGVSKTEYWKYTFEDVMELVAKLPALAAYIYRRKYHGGNHIAADKSLDWAGNFAHMLGYSSDGFKRLMRLYLTIHVDHEGGNVSAHATKLVGSALSDPYLSFSAAMNGLAGPLHGLANQEVIRWIFGMLDELGTKNPTAEEIKTYCQKTLDSGRVVPGFGHAVLRKTDPRYMAQREFALKHLPNDELFGVVSNMYDIVPEILAATGKVKNPWPNVDAHSGCLLLHYNFEEYDFYTVLFGVSRALGVLASLIWDRYLGLPLERPKSFTSEAIMNRINSVNA
ncbi:MAG: citrate (Si)-synthase, eukaryotic [Bacteroidetes bacterium]|nr:citrate (Si)-synthase, eukaryotic [Bacteroidota bacterium]